MFLRRDEPLATSEDPIELAGWLCVFLVATLIVWYAGNVHATWRERRIFGGDKRGRSLVITRAGVAKAGLLVALVAPSAFFMFKAFS